MSTNKAQIIDTGDNPRKVEQIQVWINGQLRGQFRYDVGDHEQRYQAKRKAMKMVRDTESVLADPELINDSEPPIDWNPIDIDDFTAYVGRGYILRAEEMGPGNWWWCTYWNAPNGYDQIDSGHEMSLEDTKHSAEKAYRNHRSKTK